ncbi:MAG TPA: DNA methyltransferase, partial [Polyangia bacterium]|nr:DNA methyltransferase [Polyangia bacterium]
HQKLCHTRVLDPACGSGNFLYVTLDLFKRLEGEVLSLLESLGEKQTLMHMESVRVTPAQFHGIEIKRWAKEIAELVLWIGYLQWHFRMYGKTMPVPEPVLHDYKNIECRDAVLAYDGEPELVRDEKGKPVTRWDGESTKKHPATGTQVPDDGGKAQKEIYRYKNPRQADWPQVDFIVGNPPFVGNKRMRLVLGDGYVEALRSVYSDVPDTIDYVMYWWHKAAELARRGRVRRFGLITTNSITQAFSRKVVQAQMDAADPLSIVFAIPDHPWVDSESGAAVRIAMTTGAAGALDGTVLTVAGEEPANEGCVDVLLVPRRGEIHCDLSIGAAVTSVAPLLANREICQQGVKLVGPRDNDGFVVQPNDLGAFGGPGGAIKPYVSNRDIVQKPTRRYVIDFFGKSEREARLSNPAAFQRVLDQVKPFREQNRDPQRKRDYWLFGRSNVLMRQSIDRLARYIITPEVAKHRPFLFVDGNTVPDASLYVVGSEDAFDLGILSSRIHVVWFLASCGKMGVGNDPRYQSGPCFDPFPFPVCTDGEKKSIRGLAEELDAHRKRQQAAHPDLTITGMYNVLEKLRSGEALTAKDKVIHEQGLVSVLKKLHDDLDAAVFDAYGWPHDLSDEQILERLVALNAERAAEEKRGLVRWLRPEFQNPSGAKAATQEKFAATDEPEEAAARQSDIATAAAPWPKKLAEQIAAIRDIVTKAATEWSVEQVAGAFKGANKADVEEVLDSLAALGILAGYKSKGARRWKLTRATA